MITAPSAAATLLNIPGQAFRKKYEGSKLTLLFLLLSNLTRSLCSLVCKWTYSAEKGWDDSFWKMVGLEDLIDDNYSKIGKRRENSKSDHSCGYTKIFVIFLFELYYKNSVYFFLRLGFSEYVSCYG